MLVFVLIRLLLDSTYTFHTKITISNKYNYTKSTIKLLN